MIVPTWPTIPNTSSVDLYPPESEGVLVVVLVTGGAVSSVDVGSLLGVVVSVAGLDSSSVGEFASLFEEVKPDEYQEEPDPPVELDPEECEALPLPPEPVLPVVEGRDTRKGM